jgi:tetratricopeptide (TPR) repeat protein
VKSTWAWLTGSSMSARSLRVVSAILLLSLGSVDQLHYYYALHRDNLQDLKKAASLNSFDSPLQTNLGAAELQQGQLTEALTAWRQAIVVNPANPAPRDAILQTMVAQKDFQQAYALSGEVLRHDPNDADLLVNHGIFASNLGFSDEALRDWRKALEVDPKQVRAHLYIANALDRSSKPQEAIAHYVAYLDQVDKLQSRPPAQETIAIVLRLAECQVQAKRPDQAALSYELAQRIASQTGQSKLESFSDIKEAELRSAQNKRAEALRLYQSALRLDAQAHDSASEGADWYNFALFLRDQGLQSELVYAALLKSESLLKSTPDREEIDLVSGARRQLERTLGHKATITRADLETELTAALNLSL